MIQVKQSLQCMSAQTSFERNYTPIFVVPSKLKTFFISLFCCKTQSRIRVKNDVLDAEHSRKDEHITIMRRIYLLFILELDDECNIINNKTLYSGQ